MARLMGSSPLTRGKRISLFNDLSQIRLIPAHAGKTGLKPPKTSRDTAHPRSRGENYVVFTPGVGQSGSSPLTRGKPTLTLRSVMSVRLIPAHAGKTPGLPRRPHPRQAHPRSRGENVGAPLHEAGQTGSSPLTRGKHVAAAARPTRARLIPAHAGKTPRRTCPSRRREAHPRSRGENEKERTVIKNREGSSPLTRGKQECAHDLVTARRLIPAHAGKTLGTLESTADHAAHPRSRGENIPGGEGRWGRGGSSPLTRGKLRLTEFTHYASGLIPAHAGKTSVSQATGGQRAAHPRSRGENMV